MTRTAVRSPVLGTIVELRLDGEDQATAIAEQTAWASFERLEQEFSSYRPDSLLCRWRSGQADCSPDLAAVLRRAAYWYELSGGAFHPATAALTARWRQAEADGATPSAAELADLVPALPYRATAEAIEQVADCSGVELNAIAKGYIVDQAAAAAATVSGVSAVVINAGGDLRHIGTGSIRVGIEDPARPFDNAPPRWRVPVTNAALATSGLAHRGFHIGDRRLGHVLDPRTGSPVTHTASVSVLAPSAMDADALATVLGVLTTTEALEFADRHQLAALLVSDRGDVHRSDAWPG
ncbi:MAG TPA: FAD:protein FMN transferase [Propionibacteriaceae bacterium]|nr:FAD:protein FMN transferase [Propionibacteriaceae bacterium]